MNYQEVYAKVMKMSPAIRFVTICDIDGRVKCSGHRNGVKNLLTPAESRQSLKMAVLAWKTRSKLFHKIGKGKYVLAEYAKLKRITMPLGSKHLLYLTTSPGANHSAIISRIVRLKP